MRSFLKNFITVKISFSISRPKKKVDFDFSFQVDAYKNAHHNVCNRWPREEQTDREALFYPLSPDCLTLGPLISPTIYTWGHLHATCSLSVTLTKPSWGKFKALEWLSFVYIVEECPVTN